MVVSFILTLFFSLLLVYYPMPLKYVRDNKINSDVTIKQNQFDRWGVIPGDLGYQFTRQLKYTDSYKQLMGQNAAEVLVNLNVNREFANVDYQHTESIIDYTHDYTFSGINADQMKTTMMTSLNFGALSAWHQINNRPEFLNGYRAMVEMKQQYQKTDSYNRLLALNALNVAFNDENIVNQSVLKSVSAATQKAIMNDKVYGLNSSETLYQWVRAMNGGSQSKIYNDIVQYFQTSQKLADFTPTVMEQVVGDHSLLKMLNTTFTASIARAMGNDYQFHLVQAEQFYNDQWGGRFITKNKDIPLYFVDDQHPNVDTVFDLYKNAAGKIPDSFSLTSYPPELNYFLSEILHLSDVDCDLTPAQIKQLFDDDITQPTTLLNPSNLHFFFENYYQGKFESINTLFREMNSPDLNNNQINGIAKYIKYLITKQVLYGQPADPEFRQLTSFSSLLSMNMLKAYTQISSSIQNWLETRYFAAWANVNKKTCQTFFAAYLTNTTQLNLACANFPFDRIATVQYWVNAPNNDTAKAFLYKFSDLTDDQFTKIYDATDVNSLGYQIQQLKALIATTIGCASQTECTNTELTLIQFTSGKVTLSQPPSLKGNVYLGVADKCMTNAWGKDIFNCPEFVNYGDGLTLTVQ